MDTSAAVCKATSDHEKEEYRKTGRCFECGKQGHLARNCPTKKNRQNPYKPTGNSSNRIVEIEDDASSHTNARAYHWDPEIIASRAMNFTDKDRDVFVRKLQELGAEAGFVEA